MYEKPQNRMKRDLGLAAIVLPIVAVIGFGNK